MARQGLKLLSFFNPRPDPELTRVSLSAASRSLMSCALVDDKWSAPFVQTTDGTALVKRWDVMRA